MEHRWAAGESVDDGNTFEEPGGVRIEKASHPYRDSVRPPPHSAGRLTLLG